MALQRISVWVLLMACFMLLNACSGQESKGMLSGKSKHWSAVFKYQLKDSVYEKKLIIRYLGSDAATVGNVTYKLLKNGNVVDTRNIVLGENGQYEAASFAQKSDGRLQELKLDINWNNETETVTLK
ncbi:MAG: hypothetical protein WBZ33_04425 [Thermoactinomyces sp.]|jgi:hypothetical protein